MREDYNYAKRMAKGKGVCYALQEAVYTQQGDEREAEEADSRARKHGQGSSLESLGARGRQRSRYLQSGKA